MPRIGVPSAQPMNDFSTILFARPSAMEGSGRLLDFANTLTEYNASMTADQADHIAILADWKALNQDALASLAMLYVKAIREK